MKIFISYSHDSSLHKEWALKLATKLVEKGVSVTLDEWDLLAGEDIVAFMIDGITNSDHVVMVCSDNYVKKANEGIGGVGYEGLIITGELVEKIDTKKFIPIVHGNPSGKKMPTFLGPRKYISFENDGEFDVRLEELYRAIHGQGAKAKPQPPEFSGAAGPATASGRLVGPTGLIPGGTSVLVDPWFLKHETAATKGLGGLPGAMELRFALHDQVAKSQIELLNAMKAAEIQTFGWPIGIVLDVEDWRPRPVEDGIVAEIAITKEGSFSERESYDYWALRANGDFFLMQSLFEDDRAEKKMFADTRIVRVTESLMHCARLYKSLGAADDAKVSLFVGHRGLAGRQLTAASSRRVIAPTKTTANVSSTQIVATVGELETNIVSYVRQVVEPLLMLFEFKTLDKTIYENIVNDFANGRIV